MVLYKAVNYVKGTFMRVLAVFICFAGPASNKGEFSNICRGCRVGERLGGDQKKAQVGYKA